MELSETENRTQVKKDARVADETNGKIVLNRERNF